MKTTFALLFGLLLLDSGAALGQQNLPPAAQGFCNANNGIIVIWVNNQGMAQAFVCPQLQGKEIKQEPRPNDVDYLYVITDLGQVRKYKKTPEDPDPCIEWSVGGVLRVFCW